MINNTVIGKNKCKTLIYRYRSFNKITNNYYWLLASEMYIKLMPEVVKNNASWAKCHKTFLKLKKVCNKLKRLFLASLSNSV